jgi:succinoglycan biosynthesis transport protein ExoP
MSPTPHSGSQQIRSPANPAGQRGALTVGSMLGMFWRWKWASITTACIMAYVVIYAGRLIVPMYEATATLTLERGVKPVAFSTDHEANGDQTLLNGKRDLLMSTKVLKHAIENSSLKQNPGYSNITNAVEAVRARLTITISHDSPTFIVSLRDEDPQRAENGLDVLLREFEEQQRNLQHQSTEASLEFLRQQVDEARAKLDQAHKDEKTQREKYAIISTNPDDNVAATRMRSLSTQRTTLDLLIVDSDTQNQQLLEADRIGQNEPEKKQKALLTIGIIGNDPTVRDDQKVISALRAKEAQLTQEYGDKHPLMIEVHQQIKEAEAALQGAIEHARSIFASERQLLLDKASKLEGMIKQANEELTTYRNAQLLISAQDSETRVQEALFQQLLTRLNEQRVISHIQGEQMVTMDRPLASYAPLNIKPRTLWLVAVTLGLLTGIGTAMAIDVFDNRVRNIGTVEALTQMANLGRIPYIRRLPTPDKLGTHKRHRQFLEAISDLRTGLRISRIGSHCRTIAIVSAGPSEGKGTVSSNLAVSLAMAGSSVLLIDADLRKPSLHLQFGKPNDHGLSSLLDPRHANSNEPPTHLPRLTFQRLDFLCGGPLVANPADLLHSGRLKSLLAVWRNAYDYIIFDTPPLGMVSDAMVVVELTDGLILVVRERVTRKQILQRVAKGLSPFSSRILGFVYNGESRYQSRYGYHELYGSVPKTPPAPGTP